MKRYIIKEKRFYEENLTFTVEANSEEEAIHLVELGEIDDNNDLIQHEVPYERKYEVLLTEYIEEDHSHVELGGSE